MQVGQRRLSNNVAVFVDMGFLAYFGSLWLLVFLHSENVSTFNLG
jgi:hypothetical protein